MVDSNSELENPMVLLIAYFIGAMDEHLALHVHLPVNDFVRTSDYCTKMILEVKGFKAMVYTNLVRFWEKPMIGDLSIQGAICYLCCDPTIQRKIKTYPDGGIAIVATLNLIDESLSSIKFYNPSELSNLKRQDYMIIPFEPVEDPNQKDPYDITLPPDEWAFLCALVGLVKMTDHYCCNFSNKKILKFLGKVKFDTKWIATILGKFSYYEIIEVREYVRGDRVWFRDILIRDIDQFNFIQVFDLQKLSA